MAEYWQDVLNRAQLTLPVWTQYFPTLKLGAIGVTQYGTLLDQLPTVAQGRDTAVQEADGAEQAVDFAFLWLRLQVLRVPAIVEGVMDAESGLLDDLDKVYAVRPYSADQAEARAMLLAPLWAACNDWQAAQTPPRDPVVRGTVTLAIFQQRLAALPGLKQAEKEGQHTLQERRRELRRAAAVLDRLNKRFLKAAAGVADPGSAAEQALRDIPTETDSPLPEALSIKSLRQGGDTGRQLLVAYDPYDDASATAKVVQWMIVGVDAGWDHSMAVDPSGNALGPFVVGQVVRVRTRVTNASGSRESGVRVLNIQAPPE